MTLIYSISSLFIARVRCRFICFIVLTSMPSPVSPLDTRFALFSHDPDSARLPWALHREPRPKIVRRAARSTRSPCLNVTQCVNRIKRSVAQKIASLIRFLLSSLLSDQPVPISLSMVMMMFRLPLLTLDSVHESPFPPAPAAGTGEDAWHQEPLQQRERELSAHRAEELDQFAAVVRQAVLVHQQIDLARQGPADGLDDGIGLAVPDDHPQDGDEEVVGVEEYLVHARLDEFDDQPFRVGRQFGDLECLGGPEDVDVGLNLGLDLFPVNVVFWTVVEKKI